MQFTASIIAQAVNGTVEGNENVALFNFAKIEEAKNGDLTFLANPKYTHYVYETGASAVLVSCSFKADKPVATTLIRVADPYSALAALMRLADAHMNTHPTGIEEPSFVAKDVVVPDNVYIGAFSYVGSGAKIGAGVKIYPQVYVGKNVSIGNGTILYPGVKVYHNCVIGENCIIHSGVVIGGDGFGFAPDETGKYEKIPQLGIVTIENNVEIGANTTVDRATMGTTIVGEGVKLDNLVQIAHNVTIGSDTVIAAQAGVAGSAHIGSNCMLGGQTGVAGHIVIGNGVQVGAQSGIPNNVEDNSRIMGYPAVDVRAFARQAMSIKRLPDLMPLLNKLAKEQDKQY